MSAVRDALYALFPGTGEYAQRLRDAELAFADARDAGNLKELMMAVRSAVRDGLLELRSITHGLGVGAKRNLSSDSAWPEKKYLPEGAGWRTPTSTTSRRTSLREAPAVGGMGPRGARELANGEGVESRQRSFT